MKLTNKSQLCRVLALCAVMFLNVSTGIAAEAPKQGKSMEAVIIGEDDSNATDDEEDNVNVEPPEWVCQIIDCGDGGGPILKLLFGIK